ncbi:MAG: hypothetical protein ACK559_11535, partial [bacterium]
DVYQKPLWDARGFCCFHAAEKAGWGQQDVCLGSRARPEKSGRRLSPAGAAFFGRGGADP